MMVMDSMKAQRVVGQLFGPMLRGRVGGVGGGGVHHEKYFMLQRPHAERSQSGASIKVQIPIKLLVQSERRCLMSLPKKQY